MRARDEGGGEKEKIGSRGEFIGWHTETERGIVKYSGVVTRRHRQSARSSLSFSARHLLLFLILLLFLSPSLSFLSSFLAHSVSSFVLRSHPGNELDAITLVISRFVDARESEKTIRQVSPSISRHGAKSWEVRKISEITAGESYLGWDRERGEIFPRLE